MNHGGKRPGAGRPKGHRKSAEERKDAVLAIRINERERRKAWRIGNGNASKGLRIALEEYKEEEK